MENKRSKKPLDNAAMEANYTNEFAAEEAMTAEAVANRAAQPDPAATAANYAEEVGEELAPDMQPESEATPKQEEHFAGGMTVSPEILTDSVNVPKGTKHTQLEELAKQYKGSEFDQTGKNVPKYEE